METYFQSRCLRAFLVIFSLIFLFGSCETEPLSQNELEVYDAKSLTGAENAAFPTFHHNFNHDLGPWVDGSVEGEAGWCGTVQLRDRRSSDIKPSAGRGFATVMHGSCNEFWIGQGFESSAPGGGDPAYFSSSFPKSGFIQQLDVYLDPDAFEQGLAFVYSNSLFYPELGFGFRYFPIEVIKAGEALYVDGFEVNDARWYTFKYLFDQNADGDLLVNFELLQKGQSLYDTSIERTLLTGEATSGFEADSMRSGYIWFVSIQEGVELPIDEHVLRPGK